MNKKRKILTVLTFIMALLSYFLQSHFIYKFTKGLYKYIKEKPVGSEDTFDSDAFHSILAKQTMTAILTVSIITVALVIITALLAGAPRRKSARVGGWFGLVLPVFSVLFNWYRVGTYYSTRITAQSMKETFYFNAGWFWIVFSILIASIGIIVVLFTEHRDYSQPDGKEKDLVMRAGLLGSLNSGGYEISEVLITKEERKKILILFFESQEKLENAEESGETAYIKEMCSKMAPGYEVRFEADI